MTSTDTGRVVVATADSQLHDHAARWCAAAGAGADHVTDLVDLRKGWRSAGAVLVGDDLAGLLAEAAWERREHVHLVARDPDRWWRTAVAVGAGGVLAVDDDAAAVSAVAAAFDGDAEGCVLAVAGGAGGVGATTFAGSLAVESSRRGYRSLALDADPLGAGLELVLGGERAEGLRWPDLDATGGHLSATALAAALPTHRGVTTLSWPAAADAPLLPSTTRTVWAAAARAFDLLVVDLPRHDDPHGLAGRAVLTIVLVTEDVAGIASARRRLAALDTVSSAIVSVVRRGGVGPAAVEDALGRPVLVRLRRDRALSAAIDHGRGPGRSRSSRRAAGAVLDLLGLEARRGGLPWPRR